MNVHPHPLPSSEFIAGEERQSSLETQSDLVRKSSLRITSNKRGNFVCLTCYTPPDWPFEALQNVRFALATGTSGVQIFVVFDARLGDCPSGIPGYGVLNGPCNQVFNPTYERPLFSFPSCIDHTRPL